jgi:hypothetical protein
MIQMLLARVGWDSFFYTYISLILNYELAGVQSSWRPNVRLSRARDLKGHCSSLSSMLNALSVVVWPVVDTFVGVVGLNNYPDLSSQVTMSSQWL